MTRRYRIFFRILLAVYLVVLAVLCFGHFSHSSNIPRELLGIPIDKVVHFVMFLPYPLLVYLAVDKYTTKVWHSLVFMVCVFLSGCLLAALTEYIQSLTSWRSGDPMDFRADAIALAISSLAVFIVDIYKQKK